VPVHHGRAAAGVHPDLDREQGAAGVGTTREDLDLVGSHEQRFACGTIDR
jgi:hypothetical protein